LVKHAYQSAASQRPKIVGPLMIPPGTEVDRGAVDERDRPSVADLLAVARHARVLACDELVDVLDRDHAPNVGHARLGAPEGSHSR
jgi:hypothetical protein